MDLSDQLHITKKKEEKVKNSLERKERGKKESLMLLVGADFSS